MATSFRQLFNFSGGNAVGIDLKEGGDFGIVLFGVPEMVKRLNFELPNETLRGIKLAYGRMSRVALEMADKFVPDSSGTLRATGRVFGGGGAVEGKVGQVITSSAISAGDGTVSGGIVYGGKSAPYAVYVHENTDAVHGAQWNAKYVGYRTSHYNKDEDVDKYLATLRRNNGKMTRRPEERALWISEAIQQSAPEMQAILVKQIWLSIVRVCKNPLRYNIPLGDARLSTMRSFARKAGKY